MKDPLSYLIVALFAANIGLWFYLNHLRKGNKELFQDRFEQREKEIKLVNNKSQIESESFKNINGSLENENRSLENENRSLKNEVKKLKLQLQKKRPQNESQNSSSQLQNQIDDKNRIIEQNKNKIIELQRQLHISKQLQGSSPDNSPQLEEHIVVELQKLKESHEISHGDWSNICSYMHECVWNDPLVQIHGAENINAVNTEELIEQIEALFSTVLNPDQENVDLSTLLQYQSEIQFVNDRVWLLMAQHLNGKYFTILPKILDWFIENLSIMRPTPQEKYLVQIAATEQYQEFENLDNYDSSVLYAAGILISSHSLPEQQITPQVKFI